MLTTFKAKDKDWLDFMAKGVGLAQHNWTHGLTYLWLVCNETGGYSLHSSCCIATYCPTRYINVLQSISLRLILGPTITSTQARLLLHLKYTRISSSVSIIRTRCGWINKSLWKNWSRRDWRIKYVLEQCA